METILSECEDLPEAAKAELWKGRTLNRKAMAAINAAIESAASPAELSEPDTEDKPKTKTKKQKEKSI